MPSSTSARRTGKAADSQLNIGNWKKGAAANVPKALDLNSGVRRLPLPVEWREERAGRKRAKGGACRHCGEEGEESARCACWKLVAEPRPLDRAAMLPLAALSDGDCGCPAARIVGCITAPYAGWSCGRSYFDNGRRRGVEDATREILRGLSSHYELNGQNVPENVAKALNGTERRFRETS
jgi:hypothetical protein